MTVTIARNPSSQSRLTASITSCQAGSCEKSVLTKGVCAVFTALSRAAEKR
jgi:hypothetical protein